MRARAVSNRTNPYDTVIVVCGLLSIGIALVYWVMRIGFDNPVMAVARPVALALFIYTFPAAIHLTLLRFVHRNGSTDATWWSSYPFLWLISIALTGLLGRLVPATGLNSFPILASIGISCFVIVLVRWLPRASVWRTIGIFAGSAAFSVWASGVVWGRIYKNPLFYENFILDGNIHHDSLQLAALGNMLRTYHVATNGIDGLTYVPYHWGTPWLFAQWSSLTSAHVLDFYQLGFPVMMIPFFFGGTLAFAVAMRLKRAGPDAEDDLRGDFRFWFVFLAGCLGIIPLSALDAIGTWTSNLLISESYTVAVPCALMMFATAAIFYSGVFRRDRRSAQSSRKVGIDEAVFVLVGVPAGVVALGYLKISLMLLAFGAAMYALFRLRLYRHWIYAASALVTAALFYLTYKQVSLPAHREGFRAFDYLWANVRPAWFPFFFIVHLFWSWLYILARLRSEGIGTLADLREAAAERRILDVEIVAVVAIVGIGPGLVLHIDGGSAFYFSDVQRWLALGLALSRLPMLITAVTGEWPARSRRTPPGFLSRLDNLTLKQLVAAFLLLPVIASMLANSVVWPLAMARANAETRHALYPPALANAIPHGLHGLPYLGDHAALETGLRASRNFVVAEALRRLSAIPDSTRRRTALFIPQSQKLFWTSLTRPGACTFQPLIATSFASVAMIDGMPPFDCKLSRYYGIGQFQPRRRPQTEIDTEPPALCRRAAAEGLDRVLVLTFPDPGRANTTTLQCPLHS